MFLKRHVFVKVAPGATYVLSGMVTSSTTTACSLQAASVALRVGVMVGDAVALGKGVLVSGRVEVRKRGVGLAGSGVEMVMHEARINTAMGMIKRSFLMR